MIFDRYNPSFRYAEGDISQSYLHTKLILDIPSSGIEEMRTYIIGLNSFEVSTNSPISIYSKLNRVFAIEIGPLKPNC